MEIPAAISGVPVTEISAHASYGLSDPETVSIPPNITRIGDAAFSQCSNLESVTFSEGLTEICDAAYHDSGRHFVNRGECI